MTSGPGVPSGGHRHLRAVGTYEDLRHELTALREAGEPFPTAWPLALRRSHVGDREQLYETRDAWQRAYENGPQTSAERAVTVVFDPDIVSVWAS